MKTLCSVILMQVMCTGTVFAGNEIFKQQFVILDTNRDGFITRHELRDNPEMIRFTNFYGQDSFSLADFNKDGMIDIKEYVANEEILY